MNFTKPEQKNRLEVSGGYAVWCIYSRSKILFTLEFGKTTAAPSASSSSECLSSDEGYVGSYSDGYDFNHKLAQNAASSSRRSQQDTVHIQIPALFGEDAPDADPGPDQLELDQKFFPKLDAAVADSETCVLFEDAFSASFGAESRVHLEQLSHKILSDKLSAELVDETEMAGGDWRKVLLKRARDAAKQGELWVEDERDLNAYLNEIDLNVNYCQSDQVYLNSWTHHCDIDQCLKFSSSYTAFN
ncbi:hypothetical protein BpHYR1_037510, partial [Brachionus plicatilis]